MINKFNKPMELYLNRRMKVSIFQDEVDSEALISEEELALRKSYIYAKKYRSIRIYFK